jgi:hypothetical protein
MLPQARQIFYGLFILEFCEVLLVVQVGVDLIEIARVPARLLLGVLSSDGRHVGLCMLVCRIRGRSALGLKMWRASDKRSVRTLAGVVGSLQVRKDFWPLRVEIHSPPISTPRCYLTPPVTSETCLQARKSCLRSILHSEKHHVWHRERACAYRTPIHRLAFLGTLAKGKSFKRGGMA